MIPKIIHFCWFGKSCYGKLIEKCLESWKKYLPNYEFILWNECTFDVNSVEFTKKAYADKKWAFVSDYVRLIALQKYGGIYLDTDIEVLKDFSSFLEHDCLISSFTEGGLINTFFIASPPNHEFINDLINLYNNYDLFFNTYLMNNYLFSAVAFLKYGIKPCYKSFKTNHIILFDEDYFAPYRKNIFNRVDNIEHKNYNITSHTYIIHHDMGSWSKDGKLNRIVKGSFRMLLPHCLYNKLKICKNKRTINRICNALKIKKIYDL